MTAFNQCQKNKEEELEETVPENKLKETIWQKGSWFLETAFDLFHDMDLMMWAQLEQTVEELEWYENIVNQPILYFGELH